MCVGLSPMAIAQNETPHQLPIAQQRVSLPSAPEVLTNYLRAIGGTSAWNKLKSQIGTGTYHNDQFGSDSCALEVYKKAPNKWQFTIRAPDGSVLQQGFNGTVGWDPSGQLADAQVAIMGRLLGLESGVNLPRLLPKMKLVGTSKAGTNEAFVIEAPIIEGNLEKLYFDAKTGLLLREELGGGSLNYEDYRELDGVKVPFILRQEGSPNWTAKFKDIKHNVLIEDSKFERPRGP